VYVCMYVCMNVCMYEIELIERERDNCTTLSQLNSTQQWNNVCVDCWLEISNLFLSHTTLKWLIVFEMRMWEHTFTHSHSLNMFMNTHVWKCVESEWNVENGYNLIENWELQLMFVELNWQNDTEYFILSVCFNWETYTKRDKER
jgi:hypothetical protein